MSGKIEKEQLEASYRLGHLIELAWNLWNLAMNLSDDWNPPYREEERENYRKCFRNMNNKIRLEAPDVIFTLNGCLDKFDLGSGSERYFLSQDPPPVSLENNSYFTHPTKAVVSSSHEAGLLYLKHYFLETDFWDSISDDFEFDDTAIHWINSACEPDLIYIQLRFERSNLLRSVFSKEGAVETDYTFDNLLKFTSLGRTRLNEHIENASKQSPHAGLKKGQKERHSREQVCFLLEFILTQKPIQDVQDQCKKHLEILRSMK